MKRIRNNCRVRVCKCDRQGNLESDWIEAEARILTENDQEMRGQLAKKYGLMYQFFYFMGKMTRKDKNRVVIEIYKPV